MTPTENTQPSVPNPCVFCGRPIYGSFVGAGDGLMRDGGQFAHPPCYEHEEAMMLAHLRRLLRGTR